MAAIESPKEYSVVFGMSRSLSRAGYLVNLSKLGQRGDQEGNGHSRIASQLLGRDGRIS